MTLYEILDRSGAALADIEVHDGVLWLDGEPTPFVLDGETSLSALVAEALEWARLVGRRPILEPASATPDETSPETWMLKEHD